MFSKGLSISLFLLTGLYFYAYIVYHRKLLYVRILAFHFVYAWFSSLSPPKEAENQQDRNNCILFTSEQDGAIAFLAERSYSPEYPTDILKINCVMLYHIRINSGTSLQTSKTRFIGKRNIIHLGNCSQLKKGPKT